MACGLDLFPRKHAPAILPVIFDIGTHACAFRQGPYVQLAMSVPVSSERRSTIGWLSCWTDQHKIAKGNAMPGNWDPGVYRERAQQWRDAAAALPPGDTRDAYIAIYKGYDHLADLIERDRANLK
jgi:hypothetical protein